MRPEPARSSSSAPRSEAPQPQRKLSFKEKHALETLPGTMKSLEAEIATLESRLADSSLFARDPAAFDQAAARLAAARTELSHAEEQWLEIEMKRESLEG